eukprot:TRINITY_DN1464_c0_g1_i2.p1 TRINITY_DN1464_c0_g1~~TRINITY_DN1464_c0_g1_i2.p1  ORF type:complete len:442 (-),score=101.17 TRINITY_DN1464_c0_g1_i2:40-1365(-)
MLSQLPEEVIVNIISLLTQLHDIQNLASTCKFIKRICEEDSLWYKFCLSRYFNGSSLARIRASAPNATWRYLFQNKSKIENWGWTQKFSGENEERHRTLSFDKDIISKTSSTTSSESKVLKKTPNQVVVKSRYRQVNCMKFNSSVIAIGGGSDIWDFEPDSSVWPFDVTLYDAKYAKKLKSLPGHRSTITSVYLHQDWVISGGKDASIFLWKPEGSENWSVDCEFSVADRRGHTGKITSLSVEGNILVSSSSDKTIQIWDLEGDSSWSKSTILNTKGVNYAQLKDGKILACCGKEIFCYDAETKQNVVNMRGHQGRISTLQSRYDQIVSAGSDGTVRMFDIRSGKNVRTIKSTSSRISNGTTNCLQWDENKVICGNKDGAIRIFDMISGERINKLEGHHSSVTCLQYDGCKILSGSLDRSLRLWNFRSLLSSSSSSNKALT